MNRREIPIETPCGADWSAMTATEARARLCAQCNTVVHDLSAMSEREARELTRSAPACVRYLYDVHGRVLLGGAPAGARVIPASSLLTKAAQSRWLAAAALAATAIVFEACGGHAGDRASSADYDKPEGTPGRPFDDDDDRTVQRPSVGDGGDGGDGGDRDGGDAGDASDADPDAGD